MVGSLLEMIAEQSAFHELCGDFLAELVGCLLLVMNSTATIVV